MGLPCYLAMTAAEFSQSLPPLSAWMACHFSSHSQGLSNLPTSLPKNAMLIVDDSTPFADHDPRKIQEELCAAVQNLGCKYVLLDLQRPDDHRVQSLCDLLAETLPCPVIVSESYAKDRTCPVFLSPPPLFTPLDRHFAPWQGRNIWLEAALDRQVVMVTETGAARFPCEEEDLQAPYFYDEQLFCRYKWVLEGRTARFAILRTKDDLSSMLQSAEDMGVVGAVGLYQELKEPVK